MGTSEPYHTPTLPKFTSYSRGRILGPLTAQEACHRLARCRIIWPNAIISNLELRMSMRNRSLLSKGYISLAWLLPACLLLASLAAARSPQEQEKKTEEDSKVASIEVTP